MTTLSIRCSEELKGLLLDELKEFSTGNEKAAYLLESVKNAVNVVNIDVYEKEIKRLRNIHATSTQHLQTSTQNLQEENQNLQLQLSDLQEDNKNLQSQLSDLQASTQHLQASTQNLQTSTQHLQEENQRLKNVYATSTVNTDAFPEPAKSILKEYSQRMNVDAGTILIDMFIRYVTEQYSLWFFDFCVKKSEFKDVCGYSHSEVLTWLNEQKK